MKSYKTREGAQAWVETLVDGNGMSVDEYIRPLVAALGRLGVHTTMSCHGHEDLEGACPWVSITTRDLEFVAGLVAKQNRPNKDDGKPNKNWWVLYPMGDRIMLLPFNRRRHLAKMRVDAYEFAEFLHSLADRG
jgi:hypothetical protein